MAFLLRMSRRKTELNYLCSQFKRTYLPLPSPCFSAHNNLPTTANPYRLNEGFLNVRFFAAPIQYKKKEETEKETKSKKPRMNDQIKLESLSTQVRLVVDGGHEIMSLRDAIERAKSLDQDLVEVDKKAEPIVCKIMNYGREINDKKKLKKERTKSKAILTLRKGDSKEVRLSPKIDKHDLQMKADMAKRLMEQGYRVKCMVLGTEEGLGDLIHRLLALLEDIAYVESGPMVVEKQAYMVVRHVKYGLPKKGGKAKYAASAILGSLKATRSQSTGGPSSPIQQPADLVDPGDSGDSVSGNDHKESFPGGSDPLSTTPEQYKMKSWSLSDANGAEKSVFDFIDDMGNADTSSDQRKKSLLESAPPNVMGLGANTSENRYSRQDLTRRGATAAAERSMQPAPGRAQMPQAPSWRAPPGSEKYVFPGPDPNGFKPPPRGDIPKQNPSTPDGTPSSTSYGIFSNPNASPFESRFGRGNSTKP